MKNLKASIFDKVLKVLILFTKGNTLFYIVTEGLKMQKCDKLLGDVVATIIDVKDQSYIVSLLERDIDVVKGAKLERVGRL